MSKRRYLLRLAVVAAAGGLLWGWGASVRGGLGPVLLYSIAGAATGIVVGTTSRLFALFQVDRSSVTTSGVLGILFLTPLIAVWLSDVVADPGSSVVLLISAIAAAAIAGALWGIFERVREAFADWRHRNSNNFIIRGAHT